ncbi:MAG: HD domain-containing phosphohydrolase [Gemmatimonadota bacterium]|nr:HD domain-containing phosphohydrolase [Gemmatimonadota bacterium]
MSPNDVLRPEDRPVAIVVMTSDEPDRDEILETVERFGCRIEPHEEAGTALEAVEYGSPALVVHGFDLPDMDGATFHTAVRKRAGGRTIPTLALLPEGLRADEQFDRQTGITDHISRPFDRDTLRSRLRELLPDLEAEDTDDTDGDAEPARPATADRPNGKEPEMIQQTASAEPARETGSAPASGGTEAIDLHVRLIGLGEWGVRGAELFAEQGIEARAVDAEAAVDRAALDPERRHRIEVPGRAGAEDWAAGARALAADESLAAALSEDVADADLLVVAANVGIGAGALLATMLKRMADIAPDTHRLAIARLPGLRSGPEERALALVALNAVLQAPETSVMLVQPGEAMGGRGVSDSDPHAPFRRLLSLWRLSSGADGEGIRSVRGTAMAKFMGTPGFFGWRELDLAREDCASTAGAWHEKLVDSVARWQPTGFDWSEAQAVLPMVKAPGAWLDEGGRQQFERLVQASWDEAAPCTLLQGLYVGEQPARALLLSSGMPYPESVLALRDSVQADRERLAEKRKAAESLIPLDDDFLPEGTSALIDVPMAAAPEAEPEPVAEEAPVAEEIEPEAEEAPVVEEIEPEVEEAAVVEEIEPEAALPEPEVEEEAPEPERELPAPDIEPEVEPLPAAEAEATDEVADEEPEPAGPSEDIVLAEPGAMPPSYETALDLVRRIMDADDLRAEVDLGEIRYALYDLLEILREEPEAILPEVFRATTDEWFERHHVNVAVLAILAGDRLRGSLSEVIDLGTAALLHDVGMTPTRDTWDDSAKLPPEVFESTIEPHPEEGFERLQDVPGMTAPVARMVLEEHERVDGTGYPEGLTGDAIDPGARILAVCDMLEALSHPRPHRDHLPLGEALGRLRALGEHSLDAEVVDALLDELTSRLNDSK